MTSSKSFRATLLPSFRSDTRSVSASTTASTSTYVSTSASFRTTESTATSTSTSTFTSAPASLSSSSSRSKSGRSFSLLKSLRYSKSSAELLQKRPRPAATAPAGRKKRWSRGIDFDEDEDDSNSKSKSNPVDSSRLTRRASTWNIRVSSLLPLLTSQTSDATQLSIRRKAVPADLIPAPTSPPPPPPPTQAPPPPPVPVPVPQSPETMSTPSDRSGHAITAESEPHPFNLILPFPSDYPPEPPSLSVSPDMPEISVSAHLHTQMLDPMSPLIKPSFVSPVFPKLDAKDWTLQTSLLDDHMESGPLRQTRPDYGPRKDSLPDAKPRSVSAHVPLTTAPPVVNVNGSQAETLPGPPKASPTSLTSHTSSRAKLRRSWMPGGRSRANSFEINPRGKNSNANVSAWVIAEDSRAEYNTSYLKNGDRVPELWNDDGSVLVYLFPKGSGHGPSFKVPEFTISTSHIFNELIRAEMETPSYGHRSPVRNYGGSLSAEDATRIMSPPISPSEDYSDGLTLYIPTRPSTQSGRPGTRGHDSPVDLNRLIAIRNLFAFLTGQPLVGTKAAPNNFRALLGIADLLEEFCFASPDGNTFGSAVDLSFSFYMDQLGLADCRYSREETLEALILAERMRCVNLYNEAFAHGAGKYAAIMELRLPIFEQVSQLTRERLERAHLDLVNRQHNVNEALEQFEFPSLFAGIANSTSIPELRAVRFKIWKTAFQKMRQFVLGYYRNQFGSWPPKASNKKSPFSESGLNRLVLKALYSDMCAVYDLLVDRNNLTSRVIDEVPAISEEADKMTTSALRNILSEFDRSKPPVLPPIPFDLPQIPSMTSVLETYNTLSAKEQAKFDKKVKEHELILVLNKAYNYDVNGINIPFLDQFKEFELREAKGKSSSDLTDHRIGYWLFLYAVLQSLPMLVVDAPDLEHTEGTEYFLCEPPMGNPPWIDARQVRKMWYEVSGGGGYVELSADAVMFSPEAVYHRSHCWQAAKRWEEMNELIAPSMEPPSQPPQLSPLQPPQNIFEGVDGFSNSAASFSGNSSPSSPSASPKITASLRNQSPGRRRVSQAHRSSIIMGLEPVPLEPPSFPGSIHQRSSSLASGLPTSRLSSRNVSAGNLASMNVLEEVSLNSPASKSISGATFDDILGETEKKRKADKKKSRFF